MKSEKILYLECLSGISGDMTVAALLDLGADEEKLRAALASLPLTGYELRISRVKKSGLDACDFAVQLDEAHENHDHDMAYLHGHEVHGCDERAHDPVHGENGHTHSHDMHLHGKDSAAYSEDIHTHGGDGHVHGGDGHAHGHHHHEHRGLPEIRALIEAGILTPGARQLALRIFDILADAEAKAHGSTREQVHFHEVGAVDSIVDIVAVAVCLDDLAPERVVFSPLSEGNGTVRCQHGILPVPVPAVANIVAAYGLPIHRTKVEGELVTPTGAAIAAALMQEHRELPADYVVRKVGVGAGKRDYATAGIVRAMWIEPSVNESDTIVKLEANIDDATGEELGHCMDRLMEAGARDVSFVPIYMKKNRPAYEIHVICMPQDVCAMEEILFRETTTIGIRRTRMERTLMERRSATVNTVYGTAQVKICRRGDLCKIYPEYESVAALCKKSGDDFRTVYHTIVSCAAKTADGGVAEENF